MVDFEIVSTFSFFAIVIAVLILDRKNFEFHYGIFIRRWKKGIYHIDNFVKKYSKLAENLGDVAVAIGIPGGIIGLILLLYFASTLQQSLGVVLPTVGGFQYPGPVFSVPFWYWILIIFIVIATHETMHAVQARLAGIPVKSYGIILFFVLPIGAFVDPDNEKIKRLSLIKKLRIFAAGSFINIVSALIVLLVVVASVKAADFIVEGGGVNFQKSAENTPAANVNLRGTIVEIDNQPIRNINDIVNVFNNIKPDQSIEIKTTEGVYTVVTIEHPNAKTDPKFAGRAYMGIQSLSTALFFTKPFSGPVPEWFVAGLQSWSEFLRWFFAISIGVAIANLLPAKPFDGGLIFEEIFRRKFGNRANTLIKISTLITFGTILFSLVGIPLIKTFLV